MADNNCLANDLTPKDVFFMTLVSPLMLFVSFLMLESVDNAELFTDSNPLRIELAALPTPEPEFAKDAKADVSLTTFPLTFGADARESITFLSSIPSADRLLAVVCAFAPAFASVPIACVNAIVSFATKGA